MPGASSVLLCSALRQNATCSISWLLALQVCAAPKRRFGTYSGPKGSNSKAAMDERYEKLQSGGGSGCEPAHGLNGYKLKSEAL